jgi:hypothetical protein
VLASFAEAIDMQQREAEKLRRELDGVAGRRGPCFPADLKQRTAKWLAEQRASGATVAELAEALGLARGTALRWSNETRPWERVRWSRSRSCRSTRLTVAT